VVGKVMDERSGAFGYDAQGEEYGDMFEKGIIDPAKVVRIALQDAASIAGLMIRRKPAILRDLADTRLSLSSGKPRRGPQRRYALDRQGRVTEPDRCPRPLG
jgi:chaperonin GroEL (HSP60 family)